MLPGSYLKQEPELMQRTILGELQLNLEPLLVREKTKRNLIQMFSRSSTEALIGDTVN